jgi:hypothetical protein
LLTPVSTRRLIVYADFSMRGLMIDIRRQITSFMPRAGVDNRS